MIKNWNNLDSKQKRVLLLIELYSRKKSGFANWIFEKSKDQSGLIEEVEELLGYTKHDLESFRTQFNDEYYKDLYRTIKINAERDGICKYAFDFFIQNSDNMPLLRDVCDCLNITYEELQKYASKYVFDTPQTLTYDDSGRLNLLKPFTFVLDHIYKAKIYDQNFQIYNRIGFFEILLLLNDEESFEFIKENIDGKISFSEYDCRNKLKSEYGEEEANRILSIIKTKLENYKRQKNQNRAEEIIEKRQLKRGEIVLIEQYILGDFGTLGEYCDFIGIKEVEFSSIIERAKSFSHELYSRYLKKEADVSKKRFEFLVFGIQKMGEEIKHGIELPDGTRRPFDILDYYQRFSTDVGKISGIINDNGIIDPTSKKGLALFVKSSISKEISETEIFSTLHSFANPDGSIRIITDEEKRNALSYLRQNKLPLTLKVYSALMRRYVLGTITFDTVNQKDEEGKRSY